MKKKDMAIYMTCLLRATISTVIEAYERYGEDSITTRTFMSEAIGVIRAISVTDTLAPSFLGCLQSDLNWLRIDLLKEHVETLSTIIRDM